MGYTAQTPENIVIGAGDILVDGVDVGATSGDNVFRIEQEMFEPEINGIPGALVGTQYITSQEGILEAGIPEISEESVGLIWPGSDEFVAGTIDHDGHRRLLTGEYHDLELVVDGLNNTFHFLVDNAANQANAEWTGQDAGMMNPRGEFHSKWSATPGSRSPHRILVWPLGS